jgi:hypothetical protein
MHTHGGMLYDTTNTNHILYEIVMLLNGLKPSVARLSLMFLESFAKKMHKDRGVDPHSWKTFK